MAPTKASKRMASFLSMIGIGLLSLQATSLLLPDVPPDAVFLSTCTVTHRLQCGHVCARDAKCRFIKVEETRCGTLSCLLYEKNKAAVFNQDVATTSAQPSTPATCDTYPDPEARYNSCSIALQRTCKGEGTFLITPPVANTVVVQVIRVFCGTSDGQTFAVFFLEEHEFTVSTTSSFSVFYEDEADDIELMMSNSDYCQQRIAVTSHNMASIHYWSGGSSLVLHSYLPTSLGTSGEECYCSGSETCCCNINLTCDMKGNSIGFHAKDFGHLTNKQHLPVRKIGINVIDGPWSNLTISLGPLRCID